MAGSGTAVSPPWSRPLTLKSDWSVRQYGWFWYCCISPVISATYPQVWLECETVRQFLVLLYLPRDLGHLPSSLAGVWDSMAGSSTAVSPPWSRPLTLKSGWSVRQYGWFWYCCISPVISATFPQVWLECETVRLVLVLLYLPRDLGHLPSSLAGMWDSTAGSGTAVSPPWSRPLTLKSGWSVRQYGWF